jgi:hypothetical protein
MKLNAQNRMRLLKAIGIGFCGLTVLPLSSLSQPKHNQHLTQHCRNIDLGTVQSCPMPLRFQRGAYGALVNDQLKLTPETRYYAFKARAGQRLTLSFVGKGALRAGLLFPNGSGDGPFGGEGSIIELPQTGTFIIYIGQNTMSGEPWQGAFSLAVLIK